MRVGMIVVYSLGISGQFGPKLLLIKIDEIYTLIPLI